MTKTAAKERPVIVTTAHRGVFFGYATETAGETIKLRAARLCVYWTGDLRGFMGLASHGPSKGCKIGPAADIELRAITSVVEAAAAADASPIVARTPARSSAAASTNSGSMTRNAMPLSFRTDPKQLANSRSRNQHHELRSQ